MKIRIVSDGTLGGTRVFDENDQPIERVTVIDWHAEAGSFATATLQFLGVPVEVVGEVAEP